MTDLDRLAARAGAAAAAVRRAILRIVRDHGDRDRRAVVAAIRDALDRLAPALSQTLLDAQLWAWATAARAVVSAAESLPAGNQTATGRQPDGNRLPALVQTDVPPLVRFPSRDAVVSSLRRQLPDLADRFPAVAEDAGIVAVALGRSASADLIDSVRELVADDVATGGTLGRFRRAIRETVEGSALGPSTVEQVYRTAVGRAHAAGQIAALSHPLVADEFPYLLYTAVHDSRTRATHLALESLGLDGTAVYRFDDPVWQLFYPPWEWNCRCAVVPLSVEDAAIRGVKEAQRWVATGRPPSSPAWVSPPPFLPPAGWVPTGARILVAA